MSEAEQTLEENGLGLTDDELKALQDVFEQLIDAIHPAASMAEETLALRQNMDWYFNPRGLIGLVQRLGALAAAARCETDDNKEERESLFRRISEKVDELDKTLMATDQQIQASFQGAQNSTTTMERQLQDMAYKFKRTSDVNSIKSWMDQRLSIVLTKQEDLQEQVSHLQTTLQGQMQSLAGIATEIQDGTASAKDGQLASGPRSLKDPVTEIPTRVGFESMLRETLSGDPDSHPFVVQFWDLDNLKQLNDSYDRQAGDRSLAMVARILSANLRSGDFIARYGSDCFALLLPETGRDTGAQIAYRLRTAVENAEFHYRGTPVTMTISGSYTLSRHGDNAESIRQRLEDALTRAKEAGRNCCFSAD